jgi:hypothetical protein
MASRFASGLGSKLAGFARRDPALLGLATAGLGAAAAQGVVMREDIRRMERNRVKANKNARNFRTLMAGLSKSSRKSGYPPDPDGFTGEYSSISNPAKPGEDLYGGMKRKHRGKTHRRKNRKNRKTRRN